MNAPQPQAMPETISRAMERQTVAQMEPLTQEMGQMLSGQKMKAMTTAQAHGPVLKRHVKLHSTSNKNARH
ncbi:hypothetical protein LG21E20_03630 [Lactococcus formosensis]|nr:hypothetical protein LG21E20_03630 [Lactococcus formosensis]